MNELKTIVDRDPFIEANIKTAVLVFENIAYQLNNRFFNGGHLSKPGLSVTKVRRYVELINELSSIMHHNVL